MADDRLGATGKFPEGKLTPGDEGELKFAVYTYNGNVVMNFGKDLSWVAMPPGLARQVAQALITEADKLEKDDHD